VEDIRTEVRRIAEGHSTLERKIEQFRIEVNARINDLENRMNLGFREVFQRLDRLEQRMDRAEQELGHIKQAVLESAKRLETHEQAHAR